jgi:hypothetical protein
MAEKEPCIISEGSLSGGVGHCVLYFLLFLTPMSTACADSWDLPEEEAYESDNGQYLFRVSPNFSSKSLRFGMCKGALLARKGQVLEPLWSRLLINNVAPLRVFVSNSGQYVVTISEWSRYDLLPVVIYEPIGRLVNVYGRIDQLAPPSEIIPYKKAEDWDNWLYHTLFFYSPNEDFFIIRASTGKTLVLKTRNGQLLTDRELEDFKGQLKKLIVLRSLKLLSSDRQDQKESGTFVLTQYGDEESKAILRQALQDKTFKFVDTGKKRLREYSIRKAARETLEKMGESIPPDVIIHEEVKERKR